MARTVTYTTGIVLLHLLVNIVHGSAHRQLRIGLTPIASAFVILVVLLFPLIAMILVWTAKKQLGLILLSASMLASFVFGLYHHFLAAGPDHIHSQPNGAWGLTFVATSYALLILEALGTYIGVHFLRLPTEKSRAKAAP
jgi:hypothetical protein